MLAALGRNTPAGAFLDGQLVPDLGAEFRRRGVEVLVEGIQEIGELIRRETGENFFRSAGIADESGEL
jgi:hypothetical protein